MDLARQFLFTLLLPVNRIGCDRFDTFLQLVVLQIQTAVRHPRIRPLADDVTFGFGSSSYLSSLARVPCIRFGPLARANQELRPETVHPPAFWLRPVLPTGFRFVQFRHSLPASELISTDVALRTLGELESDDDLHFSS